MKPVFTLMFAAALGGGVAASAASAMPRLAAGTTAPAMGASVEQARLVCNYHHCYRTGYRGYYRPYGYYRPSGYGYYRPGIGIGVGPLGIGIY